MAWQLTSEGLGELGPAGTQLEAPGPTLRAVQHKTVTSVHLAPTVSDLSLQFSPTSGENTLGVVTLQFHWVAPIPDMQSLRMCRGSSAGVCPG